MTGCRISKIKMTVDQFYLWVPKGLNHRQMADYAFNLVIGEQACGGVNVNLGDMKIPVELMKD